MSSKTLLIDIGNTRTKWCLLDGSSKDYDFEKCYGSLMNNESPFSGVRNNSLELVVQNSESIHQTILCNVAHESIAQAWYQWLMQYLPNTKLTEFESISNFSSIKNTYDSPNDLGNDRWAAIIGGTFFAPQGNYLIISSGTATTIDCISDTLTFTGGLILPGINLMLQALGSKTALLPNLSYPSAHKTQDLSLGNSTDMAILQGVMYAQLGAIQMAIQLKPNLEHIILSGGNANLLHQYVAQQYGKKLNVVLDPFLVFRGLALWIDEQDQ
jgi:type III pantothenate kinase